MIARKLIVAMGFMLALNGTASADTFPFWCRGPLKVELRDRQNEVGYVRISFSRGSSAAGSSGQNLAPGTCAWVDRTVNSSEPTTLRTVAYRLSDDLFAASGDYLFAVEASLLAQGLTTDHYRIKFKSVNNQGSYLLSHDDFILVPVP